MDIDLCYTPTNLAGSLIGRNKILIYMMLNEIMLQVIF